jgi:hypothetical protein
MDKKEIIQMRQDFFDAFDISAEQFILGVETLSDSRGLVNQKRITAKNIEEFNSDFDNGIERLRETIEALEKWQLNVTEFFIQYCMEDEVSVPAKKLTVRDPNKLPWED